ncbi:pyrroline-5-carboxylate reductase [Sphingomicrobium sp. XHP0239]|uniref:pyrroline-5-carboxylate reductase family protein n=1 Tax=Sphingomicrobium maritimum TaxID=3133972 RepID=UPI0031CC5CB8
MIGCGKMGGALLQHWKKGGEDFTIVDPFLDEAPDGIRLEKDRSALGDTRYDVLIVAIKPQMLGDILPDYTAHIADDGYALSIAAGASIERISGLLDGAPVIRVMPNLPAAVGKGVSGLVAGPGVSDAQRDHAMEMMDRTGAVIPVDSEDGLDRVTAVAGSGPGYIFEIARTYVAAARELGFDRDQARALALGTMQGTVAMALDQSDTDLETHRNNVTSKGGTTAAGLDALNGDGAISDHFKACVQAAYDRAVELR